MMRSYLVIAAAAALALAPATRAAHAQERGAAALAEAVEGLGVTARVLMIGAHPDDEDTNLIAWLSRGRHVETAYLSLTRGDGGQNLIGDELGEALGAIRTEELLAARRVDGGRQYFTRAYDFGFSKSAEETYRHWPKDELLGDVVRVVREFRPHVIVAVFSGTPRDGHGHHQVSGLLAREAYEVAGDTARFPREEVGVPWEPLKLYRSARFDREGATLTINVGEYDPVLGRSYAEIAGESRSQHKSQGFGALERKGPVFTAVRREASRVAAPEDAKAEQSIFAGIDTSWARFAELRDPVARAAIDTIPAIIAAVRDSFDIRDPSAMLPELTRLRTVLTATCPEMYTGRSSACATVTAAGNGSPPVRRTVQPDLERALDRTASRVTALVDLASSVEVEAEAVTEAIPAGGTPVPVVVRFHNRGTDSVATSAPMLSTASGTQVSGARYVAPGESWADTLAFAADTLTRPWWLVRPRVGDMFPVASAIAETARPVHVAAARVLYEVEGEMRGGPAGATAPLVHRFADPVRGDVSRPVAVVPAVSVTLDRPLEMMPANTDVERRLRVRLRSADTASRDVTVRLALPRGLAADSAARTVTLAGYDAQATVSFVVRGRMAPGRDTVRVTAESGGETFDVGYQLVDYPHIRPRRLYRPAVAAVQAVDVRVPAGLRVAYVPGVSDVVAPALRELGLDVTVIEPAELATADLSRFTTVVVGPRAYDAHPGVMASRGRLLDFARRGGTLVVQYQQYAVHEPGVVPYPMSVARPHDRVTIEEAPVTVTDPASPLLAGPNAIGATDFDGWVQERSLYMPREFDARYAAPLEMHDPGEPERRGALLVAPLGEGTYVYTAISFFRQLPAGVPGAARLFVNLLAAGRPAEAP